MIPLSFTQKQLLKKYDAKALLITNVLDIRHRTGGNFSEAVLIVLAKKQFLFVDSRYGEFAQNIEDSLTEVLPIHKLYTVLEKQKVLLSQSESMTMYLHDRLQSKGKCTIIPVESLCSNERRQKNTSEFLLLKKAQKITQKVLALVPTVLKVGISEKQLSWILETMIHDEGGDGLSFPSIVAFGAHTSRPHHAPTSKKLSTKDIVQIDIGACVDGYHGDGSAVYFMANPTDEQAKMMIAIQEAFDAGIRMANVGIACADIDRVTRSIIDSHGLLPYYLHSTGHGVGLEIHEAPRISEKSDEILLSGDVITIEPGCYIEGKFGMRIEDMVFIK